MKSVWLATILFTVAIAGIGEAPQSLVESTYGRAHIGS
jgi:hypothetical protein